MTNGCVDDNVVHMITEILDMIRAWDVWVQFFFVIIVATLGTGIGMAAIGLIGEFVNNTLPILIRGYPKKDEDENKK